MDFDTFPVSAIFDHADEISGCRALQYAPLFDYPSGRAVSTGEQLDSETQVLADLITPYLRERVRRGEITPKVRYDYHAALSHFASVYGRRPVANLSRRDVERWLEGTGRLAPGTRLRQFYMVRAFCDWLAERKHVRRSPCAGMRAPRKPRSLPRAIPTCDVQAMLTVAPDQRARLIAVLKVQEGLRDIEIERLEVGDLDLERRSMRVVGKGHHERVLHITEEATVELRRYLGMFPATGGPLVRSYNHPSRGLAAHTISGMMRKMLYDAGVKQRGWDGITGHGLRHTCATDMLRHGASVRDVQTVLGHQSLQSTQVYLPLLTSSMADAMEGRRYASNE